MKFYAKYSNGQFHPEHDSDYEAIKKLREDCHYKIEVTQPRNYEFLKKFMALINLAFANQRESNEINNFDHFRQIMTMKTGFYEAIQTDKGTVYLPKSISFASMDELQFQELYNKMLDVVAELIGSERRDILEQVVNFM